MISAGDFRNGVTFEMDGQVFQVVEFQHVKPGKGSAFVRTKYRNVKTGSVVERSFNPSEKFEQAQLERSDMSYLYQDGDLYYFMNTETYDQLPFTADILADVLPFLKEGTVCKVLSYKGETIEVELPIVVELEIIDTEPAVRGDTTNNATKNATLETGHVVKVPLFIAQNEVIRIDTRTGEYLERA